MGMIYRPKYKRRDGTIAESSVYWIKFYANGKPHRENTHTDKESKAKDMLKLREGDAVRGVPVIPKVNRKMVADLLADVVAD